MQTIIIIIDVLIALLLRDFIITILNKVMESNDEEDDNS